MVYSKRLQRAIEFAIQVHEIEQKQKRKGKDIPYITHPMSVALILSRVTDNEDVIIAGVLHDSIEDCEPYGSVTKELLEKQFGIRIAELVDAVTEQDKSMSWEERKLRALEHLEQMDREMLLLKSADVLHNLADLLGDIEKSGLTVFEKFNVPREKTVWRYEKLVQKLEKLWPENPLLPELRENFQVLSQRVTSE